MRPNKNAEKKSDKKSIHSTALLSEYQGQRIYLFQTNTQTAGKEVTSLLEHRTSTQPFTTMSDASPHNFPSLDEDLMARRIITLSLAHGRRSTPRSAYKLGGESPPPEACLKHWVPSLELMEVTT